VMGSVRGIQSVVDDRVFLDDAMVSDGVMA
jgi:hypothetical protein